MARALGNTADATRYTALAGETRAAFNARFLAPDGRYTGDSQTAYAMALAFDLAPPDRRAQVAARLREAILRKRVTLGTGFIGTALLLPALSDTGQDGLAFQLLRNTRYPSWGYMIEKGATTIWELWNSDTEGPGMNSRNHFAFGSVAEWLQRYLCGIDLDPEVPGYARFVVRPHYGGGLTHARGAYDSPRGRIESHWTRSDDAFTLRVTVPANTTARVCLPAGVGGGAAVTEGRWPVWRAGRFLPGAAGVRDGRRDGDRIAFEVGAGVYEFRVTGARFPDARVGG